MGSPRGTDHYIGLYQGGRKFRKGSMHCPEALGQVNGMLLRAIHDEQALCAIVTQITRRQFAHLPGPDQQDTRFIEPGKELTCQLDGDMTHGSSAATNARLTASTLARHECCAEQRRHDRTSKVPTLSKFERFGYLPLNL